MTRYSSGAENPDNRKKNQKQKWNLNLFGLFFLFIIILNIIFFVIYRTANPNSNIILQLWNYIQSTGLVIIISLFIPLLKLFYDRDQKIEEMNRRKRELVQKKIDKIKEKNEAKKKEFEEDLKQKQIESIQSTQKYWRKLTKTIDRIYCIDLNPDEKEIQNIINDLYNLKTATPALKSEYYYFDKLTKKNIKYAESLVKPFNTLLTSALTVIMFVRNNPQNDLDEYNKFIKSGILERKTYLENIERGIMDIYFKAILNVLNNYIFYQYGNREEIKEEIKNNMNILDKLYNDLSKLEKEDEQMLYENYLLFTMKLNQNIEAFDNLKELYIKLSSRYKNIEPNLAYQYTLLLSKSTIDIPREIPLWENLYSLGLIKKMEERFIRELNEDRFPRNQGFLQIKNGLNKKMKSQQK